MIIRSAEFIKSAVKPSQYPSATLPEIVFAGRSNVGKSSLINTIVNRKRLVKTSATPGRTQLINFFRINDCVYFVDLPGYGYAKVPISVKKKWRSMIETYLSTRKTIKGVVLIVDIRRIPGADEQRFIDWLNYHKLSTLPVLTKADKLSKTNQIKQRRNIAAALGVNEKDLLVFSAKSGDGKEDLWAEIEQKIGDNKITVPDYESGHF
jgi:GTP-binding protein